MSEDFWTSDEGIRQRVQMLSQFVVSRTWNRALQMYAPMGGIKHLRFTTAGDDRVCVFCSPYEGRTYRIGQFMKYIPLHPRCRCLYDIAQPTISAESSEAHNHG